jgi:TIR domain
MKVLEKIDLIEKIAIELQSRMTFADINTYLKAYNIDTTVSTSGVNSKRIYVKELLSSASEGIVSEIADELNIPNNVVVSTKNNVAEPTFWAPFHFKLFLSHLSSFKKTASLLQSTLKSYGISGFVAHVDIEPTKEWLEEIEAGLYSMDALAAILMPGFKESSWTDQEVGFAVGRGVLIIPIIRGLDPYGFISKYQGLHAEGKLVTDVAENIFRILSTSPKTKEKMLLCLVETTLKSVTIPEAVQKLKYIDSVKNLSIHHLERLRDGAPASTVFSKGVALAELNKLLIKHNLKNPTPHSEFDDFDDDIPF